MLILLVPAAAFALTLDEAKQKGLVGERQNGYLGLVNESAGQDARDLMLSINQGRQKEYTSIAERNKTSVSAVEALAGKKAIEKTPGGYFIEGSGGWVKK